MQEKKTEKKINNKLTQKSNSKGELRKFEIYNDKFIKVSKYSLFDENSYHINLSMLEPWPVHHRIISWRWLLSVTYFSLATFIFSLYLYNNQSGQNLSQLLPFICIFIILTLVSLVVFVYKSPDVTEFRSRYGGCALISLLQDKPNKNDFNAFIAEIKTRILAASQVVEMDKKQMLEVELSELRRLMDNGILEEQQFLLAQKRAQSIRI